MTKIKRKNELKHVMFQNAGTIKKFLTLKQKFELKFLKNLNNTGS